MNTPFSKSPRPLLSLLAAAALVPGAALAGPQDAAAPEAPQAVSAPAAPQDVQPPASQPEENAKPEEKKKEEKKKAWYERLSLRGYTQIRYNRLPTFGRSSGDIVNEQGDRFLGRNNGFGIRRARLILSGDVHERVSVYLQPDFASAIGEQLNATILRDWYADIFLDAKKEFRLRVGQSKVPFGFENLQSSSNRLPLDRNDALNSALRDERDIGVFFYWAPDFIRERFKLLVDSNLKGSGDYGVLGLGVYNGQNANRPERNDNRHVVARVTWPFLFGTQFVELGAGGYYGRYNVALANRDGIQYSLLNGENNLVDARGVATVVIYPQPLGFMAEYNVGVGPSLGGPGEGTVVASRPLHGGYAQLMYKLDGVLGHSLIPYVRGTLYDGGKKFETNAPRYHIRELEMGAEWQFNKALELTLAYLLTNRTSSRFPYEQLRGEVARAQLQFNY